MEELIKLVSQKTGLSPEHSKLAVDTVLSFVKSKLPAPIAGQIDGVLNGGGAAGVMGAISGGLGDMFK
jgi:hypothetical protein